jgi:hypothetical protein
MTWAGVRPAATKRLVRPVTKGRASPSMVHSSSPNSAGSSWWRRCWTSRKLVRSATGRCLSRSVCPGWGVVKEAARSRNSRYIAWSAHRSRSALDFKTAPNAENDQYRDQQQQRRWRLMTPFLPTPRDTATSRLRRTSMFLMAVASASCAASSSPGSASMLVRSCPAAHTPGSRCRPSAVCAAARYRSDLVVPRDLGC